LEFVAEHPAYGIEILRMDEVGRELPDELARLVLQEVLDRRGQVANSLSSPRIIVTSDEF